MSTFDGRVVEFPDIRIDYFRPSREESKPALAYFVSHVHSDHIAGLESCKSPFIYCSPATRDILLRLEKYPHRMNFAKKILETRKQTYRHLKNLLKAIPLETPTVIELCPGREIRVTLFDANHCTGAVAFLIEGGGSAVLYTGDVRSEPWWVNALTRHPVLLPYVYSYDSEPTMKLDSVYLDTTFVVTGKEDPYAQFPSKAEGLRELLQKVNQYPEDTLFYLDAWTFGYEDVWQTLSSSLGSRIHVDDYRYGLYRALANGVEPKAAEAPKLIGFFCGNHYQQACLSLHSDECRIHSCERGSGCDIWNKDFVRITPIVSRHNGIEIAELGAGGGQGDLNQQHELEVSDAQLVGQLMALCASKLHGQTQLLSSVLHMLTSLINDRVQSIKLEDFGLGSGVGDKAANANDLTEPGDIALEKLVPTLAKIAAKQKQKGAVAGKPDRKRAPIESTKRPDGLPKHITFPYSRHSSYKELCQLVEAFKPNNIHPCTVDEVGWTPSSSMAFLFGHIYTVLPIFRHDQIMLKKRDAVFGEADSSSRPASSRSSSSDYTTPKSFPSVLKSKPAPTEPTRTPELTSRHDELDDYQGESMEFPSTKRKGGERQVNMDHYSPFPPHDRKRGLSTGFANNRISEDELETYEIPSTKRKREERQVNVDHYSPPHDRKRGPSISFASDQISNDAGKGWPALKPTEVIAVDRVEDRGRKQIADSMPPEWQFEEGMSSKRKLQSRQSLNYGRLSPPPFAKKEAKQIVHSQDHFDKLAQCPKGLEEWKSRNYNSAKSSRSTSPAVSRAAFRQEVYDAVRGKDGAAWSDIGLASVNGYQIEEEEL